MLEYNNLIDEHSESEFFKETIHFMNISFPEWKTNRGIGFSAVEFILHCIDYLNLCPLEKRDNELNYNSLKTLYLSVAEDYKRFKKEYQYIFSNFALEKFYDEYESELDDEYLTDYRYNDLYNAFLNQELEKVTYDFRL